MGKSLFLYGALFARPCDYEKIKKGQGRNYMVKNENISQKRAFYKKSNRRVYKSIRKSISRKLNLKGIFQTF